MITKGWIAVAGFAAAVFSLPAAAQMNPPSLSAAYAGAEIGQGEQRFDCEGAATCDRKDTAWRVFAGYQFHRIFAAELGYADLGTAKFTDPSGSGQVETSLWDLSVIGAVPVGPVSIFGRVGGYRGETKASDSSGDSGKNDKNGWLVGAGVGYDIGRNIGLRAEWKRYMRIGGGELGEYADGDMLTIGGLWRFR